MAVLNLGYRVSMFTVVVVFYCVVIVRFCRTGSCGECEAVVEGMVREERVRNSWFRFLVVPWSSTMFVRDVTGTRKWAERTGQRLMSC